MIENIVVKFCQACGVSCDSNVRYKIKGYSIQSCPNCGVGRVNIKNFNAENCYNNDYFTGKYIHSYLDYRGSKKILNHEFSKLLDFIQSIGPTHGNLLEIGCAYGFFLELANANYQVYGVEIVSEAVENCHSLGLERVRKGELTEEYIQAIGGIDVVVMLDVIEHINDLDSCMNLVRKHMNPGAILVVTTGDWGSFTAKIFGKKWRLIAPPFHLWYFNKKSMEKMGLRHGLKLVKLDHPWKIVPLELIIQQGILMLGFAKKVSLPKFMKSFGLPVNLFDAMRVVYENPREDQ